MYGAAAERLGRQGVLSVRFSLRLHNNLPIEVYPRIARAAEAAGFDQIWVSHDLFFRSAWVILASMATVTERVQLGVGIASNG